MQLIEGFCANFAREWLATVVDHLMACQIRGIFERFSARLALERTFAAMYPFMAYQTRRSIEFLIAEFTLEEFQLVVRGAHHFVHRRWKQV